MESDREAVLGEFEGEDRGEHAGQAPSLGDCLPVVSREGYRAACSVRVKMIDALMD